MYKMIILILSLLILYTIVPYILSFGFGFQIFRRNKSSNKIAFTFDDGPDEIYTPILLDLLKKYHIKATFFVLGSKAEKHPDLIKRMHQEGHLIGVHNYIHRSNWVMAPWSVRRQLEHCETIIKEITGVKPIYYRPPWGLMNIFDYFLRGKFKIILWSLMVGDWRSTGGSQKVKNRLLSKIKKGDIILLHDSGDTLGADSNAPINTIKALKEVLNELVSKGYSCVRIDELLCC
ncbi:polysaccharide deacetylase family protein [Cytobacillus sp. Hz8]|uniref:polysaccharide deacetylase family protein n=1 Tax=Cytobacillus sp. Hz8 TaxID=3347168 RepID=UPI0035D6785D